MGSGLRADLTLTTVVLPELFEVDSLSPGFGDHSITEGLSHSVQSNNWETTLCSRET